MSTILLFNGTGSQGSTIADRLQEKGYKVISPVRSEKGIDILKEKGIEGFRTDFSTNSLIPIIGKADKVVLQVPAQVTPKIMTDFAENSMKAIQKAGNPKTVFVISSTITSSKTGIASVDARFEMVELAKDYIPYAPILSSTEYLENFSTAYRQPIMENSVVPQTIPPTFAVNYLSWNDLASYVLAALNTEKLEGKIYPIGGNEGLTGNGLAERLGKVLGKELHYASVTHEQLEGILTPILGPEVAKDYAEFYGWQDGDGAPLLNPDTAELRKLLGITLPSFEEWAKQAFVI